MLRYILDKCMDVMQLVREKILLDTARLSEHLEYCLQQRGYVNRVYLNIPITKTMIRLSNVTTMRALVMSSMKQQNNAIN